MYSNNTYVATMYNSVLNKCDTPYEAYDNLVRLTNGFTTGATLNDFIMHQRAALLSTDAIHYKTRWQLLYMLVVHGQFPIKDSVLEDAIFAGDDINLIHHLFKVCDFDSVITEAAYCGALLIYHYPPYPSESYRHYASKEADNVDKYIQGQLIMLESAVENYNSYIELFELAYLENYQLEIEESIDDFLRNKYNRNIVDMDVIGNLSLSNYIAASYKVLNNIDESNSFVKVSVTEILTDIVSQTVTDTVKNLYAMNMVNGIRASILNNDEMWLIMDKYIAKYFPGHDIMLRNAILSILDSVWYILEECKHDALLEYFLDGVKRGEIPASSIVGSYNHTLSHKEIKTLLNVIKNCATASRRAKGYDRYI